MFLNIKFLLNLSLYVRGQKLVICDFCLRMFEIPKILIPNIKYIFVRLIVP